MANSAKESWFHFTHNWVTPSTKPTCLQSHRWIWASCIEVILWRLLRLLESCVQKWRKFLHSGLCPLVTSWAKGWKMQCSDFAWFSGINIIKKFWVTPKQSFRNIRSARRAKRAWLLPWLSSHIAHITKTGFNKCSLTQQLPGSSSNYLLALMLSSTPAKVNRKGAS